MATVTILEKPDGVWTKEEIIRLEKAGVVVEILPEKPKRLVAINKPTGGKTFQHVLGHEDFDTREVDELKAWD